MGYAQDRALSERDNQEDECMEDRGVNVRQILDAIEL
jgi:hypothetical protein